MQDCFSTIDDLDTIANVASYLLVTRPFILVYYCQITNYCSLVTRK